MRLDRWYCDQNVPKACVGKIGLESTLHCLVSYFDLDLDELLDRKNTMQ